MVSHYRPAVETPFFARRPMMAYFKYYFDPLSTHPLIKTLSEIGPPLITFSGSAHAGIEIYAKHKTLLNLLCIVYILIKFYIIAYQHYLTTGMCNSLFGGRGLAEQHFSRLWSCSLFLNRMVYFDQILF